MKYPSPCTTVSDAGSALVARQSAGAACLTWAALTLAGSFACSDGARITGGEPASMSGATSELEPSPSAGAGGAPEPSGMQEAGAAAGSDSSAAGTGAGGPGTDLPSGSEPGPPVGVEVSFIAPRGPCSLAERVGSFSIEKQADFGVVQGAVAEGVVPTAIPALALEEGACELLERRTLVCIPACVGAETCGEEGSCIPYPRQVSVGTVTISGLTKATTMDPLPPANSYFAPGADNPPYEVGSEIVLAAPGDGDREGFRLFGIGSEPLSRPPRWQLEAGADLSVEWPPPSSTAGASVLIELTIDQHGASPLTLSCEFPDTGSASVPAAIVDRLIDSGVSGFPNGRIMRRTVDHVDASVGCVELVVGSPLAASVEVAGFTPCNGPADCPSEQTCNVALQRCE